MSEPTLFDAFREPLIADWDLGKSFPKLRPLLAHYTSIDALEGIVEQ